MEKGPFVAAWGSGPATCVRWQVVAEPRRLFLMSGSKDDENVRLERFDGTKPAVYKRWRRKAELMLLALTTTFQLRGGGRSLASTSQVRQRSSSNTCPSQTFSRMMAMWKYLKHPHPLKVPKRGGDPKNVTYNYFFWPPRLNRLSWPPPQNKM